MVEMLVRLGTALSLLLGHKMITFSLRAGNHGFQLRQETNTTTELTIRCYTFIRTSPKYLNRMPASLVAVQETLFTF